MNQLSKQITKITIALTLLFSISFGSDAIQIKDSRPGTLILELKIDSLWTTSEKGKILTNPKLKLYNAPQYPKIPYFKDVLVGVPSNAKINIYSSDKKSGGSFFPKINNEDILKLSDEKIPIEKIFTGNFPSNQVKLTSTEAINGQVASIIEIFPINIRSGKLTYHESITVQLNWQTSGSLGIPKLLSDVNISELLPQKRALSKDYSVKIPDYQFSTNIAKIVVDTTGWYGITQDALVDSGVDVKNIDPSTLRLWNKEDEVLIYVEGYEDNSFDKIDIIIFYGEKAKSPEGAPYDNNFYTNDNVYWLTWGAEKGKRYLSESVYPSLPIDQVYHPQGGTYRYTEKIEYDDLFLRIPDNNVDEQWDIMDHFFMDPAIHPGETVRFPFVLPKPDKSSNSSFDINVNVQGISRNDHDVEIKINERLATSGSWYGQNAYKIISDPNESLESEYLNTDTNYISLDLTGESPDQRFDQIYLNWLEVTYDKLYKAFSDYIKFSRDKAITIHTQFHIEGFTDSEIYLFKEGVSRLRDFAVDQQSENQFDIIFQDLYGENSPFYHAFTKGQLRGAKQIVQKDPITRKLSELQSSYIAITPDSFKKTLEPLINIRNGELVNIDDVYRQYSYGILSPYGIKSFLQDVYFTNNKLEYVLISLQNNNFFRFDENFFEKNYIPSMQIIVSEFGAVISDYWYSCLDDDFFSDISIGRFPVSNKDELEKLVNKTIFHNSRNTLSWDNNVLFIGGLEEKFKEHSELLLDNWVDEGYFISRLYIDQSSERTSFYGTTDTLLNYFNRGLSYINFVGHGGGAVWGDRSILSLSDIDNIDNGNKLPFVTSMTCFTGDYSNPYSLGKQMLTFENGGAIGWYGSAGKGWTGSDFLLLEPLNEMLCTETDLSIGEMIRISKYIYFVSNSNITKRGKTMLFQYNLAGDPAIKLKNRYIGNSTISPTNPEAGEMLQVDLGVSSADSVSYQFFYPYTDSIEIEIDADSSVFQTLYYDNFSTNQSTYVGQSNNISFSLPENLGNGIHNFNVSYKSNNDALQSNNTFAVQGSLVEIVEVIPENPNYLESIQVQAIVSDKHGIDSAQLFINDEFWSEMVNVQDDIYELENPISSRPPSTYITVYVRAIDGNGNETLSQSKNIFISSLPNIRPNSLSFNTDGGIALRAEIENTREVVTTAKVSLYLEENNFWNLLDEKDVEFEGKIAKNVDFFGYYPIGMNKYRIIAKSDMNLSSIVDDTLEVTLSTDYFMVIPSIGTTVDGVNHGAVGNEIVSISIEAEKVESDQIILISILDELPNLSQPDFTLMNYHYDINIIKIEWDLAVPYQVEWTVPEDPTRIYKYNEDHLTWLPVSNVQTDKKSVLFEETGSGIYAFLTNDDIDKPFVTASVNGQKYLANSFLNNTPVFSFNAYDENGVDFRIDSIQTLINYLPINDIISNINGGVGNLGIELSPSLVESDSVLSLIVQDAAGNKTDTTSLKFIISRELQLIDYGNYPNPFIDNTKFAYELSETVDELSFIIYSVEGRRIRKLTRLESLTELDLELGGYHELNWNGSNDDESIVDNGTYFYMIRAKKDKKILERTGKIVRAK